MEVSAKAEARFWAKVDKTPGHGPDGDCWLWKGSVEENGYGRFWLHDRPQFAHRVSFLIANKRYPQPQGLHQCDVRACVNPSHVRDGSHMDNMRDASNKGRMSHGDRHYGVVLSELQVVEIKKLLRDGKLSMAAISRLCGVPLSTISSIKYGRSWKHVS